MEEKLQELYDSYYEELLKCPMSDGQQSFFIGGKRQAIEDLAEILDVKLKINNLDTLCKKSAIDNKINK